MYRGSQKVGTRQPAVTGRSGAACQLRSPDSQNAISKSTKVTAGPRVMSRCHCESAEDASAGGWQTPSRTRRRSWRCPNPQLQSATGHQRYELSIQSPSGTQQTASQPACRQQRDGKGHTVHASRATPPLPGTPASDSGCHSRRTEPTRPATAGHSTVPTAPGLRQAADLSLSQLSWRRG